MDRIPLLLPLMRQIASPARLAVIDFWANSDQAKSDNAKTLLQMGDVICGLRDGADHKILNCDEATIWQLPQTILGMEFDGLVVLPPLGPDRGVMSSILVRQQQARQQLALRHGLFSGEPESQQPPDSSTEIWGNVSRAVLKQRDLQGQVLAIILATLPERIAVTIISTAGILSGGGSSRLRETIRQSSSLKLVVELGDKWPGLSRDCELVAIGVNSGNDSEELTHFFKVPQTWSSVSAEVQSDFKALIRRQGGKSQYGYVLRDGLPAASRWLVDSHHPRWEEALSELQNTGALSTLGNLGEFQPPLAVSGSAFQSEPTPWPAIHPRQIISDGDVDLDTFEDSRYWKKRPPGDDVQVLPGMEHPSEQLRVLPGDVLIRELRPDTDMARPIRIGEFCGEAGEWFVGSGIIRFRFFEHIEPMLRQYILAFLRSAEAARWLAARNPSPRLIMRDLAELPIAVPDKGVLMAFKRLRQTHDQFAEWATQLQTTENRLFNFETPMEARRELLEVSARAQQRIAAAIATETLSWRIRNLYPHPLAFRWRTVEIHEHGVEKYLELLRAAEACAAYAAIVGCVLAESLGPKYALESLASSMQSLRDRPGNGLTFGTWITILEELNGAKYRELDPTIPFIEATQIKANKPELLEILSRLVTQRNHLSHDRGPSEYELKNVLPAAEIQLEEVFEGLDFLSRYSLRNIQYTRRLGKKHAGSYAAQDLVGDHPVPALRNFDFEGEAPATGLNLVDQSGRPHFVEPWLVRRPCSKCNHEETYILDRYMRDGSILLKSLEYGHESDATDLRTDFQAIQVDLPAAR